MRPEKKRRRMRRKRKSFPSFFGTETVTLLSDAAADGKKGKQEKWETPNITWIKGKSTKKKGHKFATSIRSHRKERCRNDGSGI